MIKRIITGAAILAIFLPLIIVESLFGLFQIMMILMTVVGAIEMLKMYDNKKKTSLAVKIITIFSTLLVYFSTLTEWTPKSLPAQGLGMFNIHLQFLPTSILVLLLVFSCTVFDNDFDGNDVGKILTAIFYVGIGFSSITVLKYLGARYIVLLFMVTMLTDSFAFFTGVMFGKHKMCPRISPKKTWEGAFGGAIIASIFSGCFAIFYGPLFEGNQNTILVRVMDTEMINYPSEIVILIIFVLMSTIITQIGDLVASRLKRTYEIKDFGNIFPGHGGVLDRFDSAIFTSIFMLAIFHILNYFAPLNDGLLGSLW